MTSAGRPATLERCLWSIHESEVRARDVLVIDDSNEECEQRNLVILRRWRKHGRVLHLGRRCADQMIELGARTTTRHAIATLLQRDETYPIPSVRNRALLLIQALDPGSFLLLDDDVMLSESASSASSLGLLENGGMWAPRVCGLIDMDPLSRLLFVLRVAGAKRGIFENRVELQTLSADSAIRNVLYRSEHDSVAIEGRSRKWGLSTQALAVCIDANQMLPFPRGHDEDFHWSFMIGLLNDALLLKDHDCYVVHDPPAFSIPTADGLVSNFIGRAISESMKALWSRNGEYAVSRDVDAVEDALSSIRWTEFTRGGVVRLLGAKAIIERIVKQSDDSASMKMLMRLSAVVDSARLAIEAMNTREELRIWFDNFRDRIDAFRIVCNEIRINRSFRNRLSSFAAEV